MGPVVEGVVAGAEGAQTAVRALNGALSTGWARSVARIGTVCGVLSRRAAALSLGTLLVAGCSGGSDPTPSTLPTLTSTPSPTVTLAPVPPAATALTPQGADAFARFFYTQLNIAFKTSNAAMVAQLSDAGCTTCKIYEKGLRESLAAGKFFNGDTFKVIAVAAAPPDAAGSSVDVVGQIPARDIVNAQGTPLKHITADGRFHFVLQLKRVADRWVVAEISGENK